MRNLGFTNNERKRLIDRVNRTVDGMRSLDRQIQNLEKRAEATRSDDQKKEYKKQSRAVRGELEKLEVEAGLLSRSSSAPSARSSRATWTPSTPSAS